MPAIRVEGRRDTKNEHGNDKTLDRIYRIHKISLRILSIL